eukprot:NODE_234_length_13549_cov_0.394349.p2 type:complete len:411 gc:universal NODE_234_length_13549_cov_0.394349:4080-2848(-)
MEAISESSCQYCGISYLIHSKMKAFEQLQKEQYLELDRLRVTEKKYELLLIENSALIIKTCDITLPSDKILQNKTVSNAECQISNKLLQNIRHIQEVIRLNLIPAEKTKMVYRENATNEIKLTVIFELSRYLKRICKTLESDTRLCWSGTSVNKSYSLFPIMQLVFAVYKVLLLTKPKTILCCSNSSQFSAVLTNSETQVVLTKISKASIELQTDDIRKSNQVCYLKNLKAALLQVMQYRRYLQSYSLQVRLNPTGEKAYVIPNISALRSQTCDVYCRLECLRLKLNRANSGYNPLSNKPHLESFHCLSVHNISCESTRLKSQRLLKNVPKFENKSPIENLEIQRLSELVKLQCEERNYLLRAQNISEDSIEDVNASRTSLPSLGTDEKSSIEKETTLWNKMMTRKKIRK